MIGVSIFRISNLFFNGFLSPFTCYFIKLSVIYEKKIRKESVPKVAKIDGVVWRIVGCVVGLACSCSRG